MIARTAHAVYPISFASAPPLAVAPAPANVTTPAMVAQAREARASGQTDTWSDPIMRRSVDSAAMLEYWDLTDTIVDGINALRKAGSTYLPKFTDEDANDYGWRLNNATKLTNVYRDIVESLASKPFEKEVSLIVEEGKTIPEDILEFIENVDGAGNQITQFASLTFFNGINSAIDWIYVDHPPENPSIRTQADAKAAGVRPYWSHILGRNVLEPVATLINGTETLTYIRIFEPGSPNRVRIFERQPTGTITWQLWEQTDSEQGEFRGARTRFKVVGDGTLSISRIPLVPFATGRRDGRSFRYFPAMRDAADLQIELYQQESGLKFAKMMTAYPMLAGNGVAPPKDANGNIKKLAVGCNRVLFAPPNGEGRGGQWTFVEPSATSLTFLGNDIKDTIAQLRELGRQPLTAQSGNLTVITAATAAGKAKSAVGAWGLGLKDALENALVLTCMFKGITTEQFDPQVFVYADFDAFTDGKDLDALQNARKERDISHETFINELKRRNVLAPEVTAEDEMERLLDETPDDDGAEEDTVPAPVE